MSQSELRKASGNDSLKPCLACRYLGNHLRRNPANASPQFAQIEKFLAQPQYPAARWPEISARQTQQCRFNVTVRTQNGPMLASIYLPVDRGENIASLLPIGNSFETNQLHAGDPRPLPTSASPSH